MLALPRKQPRRTQASTQGIIIGSRTLDAYGLGLSSEQGSAVARILPAVVKFEESRNLSSGDASIARAQQTQQINMGFTKVVHKSSYSKTAPKLYGIVVTGLTSSETQLARNY
jgi:hypothetical protein